jgi:ABC-type phosphate transport system ATPase subunit
MRLAKIDGCFDVEKKVLHEPARTITTGQEQRLC